MAVPRLMFGVDPLGPRFNILIPRDSHLYGYNLGSAGPLRHLGGVGSMDGILINVGRRSTFSSSVGIGAPSTLG